MERMILRTIPVSSLCKLFPERDPENERRERFTMLRNEPLSFQIAYRLEGTDLPRLSLIPEIESDLPVSLYEVGCVPCRIPKRRGCRNGSAPAFFPTRFSKRERTRRGGSWNRSVR